jgi:hypothetical protein
MNDPVSLRIYGQRVAALLGTTPDALYERQKSLLRAGLLQPEGRGRGGGTKATPKTVALLLIALLASDSPADAGTRAKTIANLRAEEKKTFVDVLSQIIGDKKTAIPFQAIVSRDHPQATIEWSWDYKVKRPSFFVSTKGLRSSLMSTQTTFFGAGFMLLRAKLLTEEEQ